MMFRTIERSFIGGIAIALFAIGVAPLTADQTAKPERFTALAVPPPAAGSATPIDIIVERWSTAAENEKVMTALIEVGTKGVLEVLQKLPRVASFAPIGAAGYPVRYAWKTKGADGIERMTLITDRWVNFWEAYAQPRSLDYPITVIELRIKPGGEGDGHIVVAAKMGMDRVNKTIIVENYDIEPIQLLSVKRSK